MLTDTMMGSPEYHARADEVCLAACRAGRLSPHATFVFFSRYAAVNGFAGPLVARLASAIGLSRGTFVDGAAPADIRDRDMHVASLVYSASIDEFMDKRQHNLPHRTLAQALVQAAAEYARLDAAGREELSRLPSDYAEVLASFTTEYQGQVNDERALTRALGYHAASELRADREYALIDQLFRRDHADDGFGQWLRSTPTVGIDGARLSGWYWIVVHGRHDGRGVEMDHYENAARAIELARAYGSLAGDEFDDLVTQGATAFVQLINRVFQSIDRDYMRTAQLDRQQAS